MHLPVMPLPLVEPSPIPEITGFNPLFTLADYLLKNPIIFCSFLFNFFIRTDEEKSRELLKGIEEEVKLDQKYQPALTPEQDIAARY
jgi:hypothetical protein